MRVAYCSPFSRNDGADDGADNVDVRKLMTDKMSKYLLINLNVAKNIKSMDNR